MTFKKLALAAAIATVPMASFAVEVMDDAALASATGQDGIAINLDLDVTTTAIVHDTDGIDAAYQTSHGFAGAIVVTGLDILATGVVVEVDAGDSAVSGGAPVLNVNVNLANGLTMQTGSIGVANSRRDEGTWGVNAGTVTVLSNMTISIGATQLNVQLANEPQGAMIRIDTAITGGLVLSNMALTDASVGGGSLGSATTTIVDAGGSGNLTVDVDVDIVAGGLQIGINTLNMDVLIEDQYLGNALSIIGDVELTGLDLSGSTITISGK